jgi:hypothetical protein
MELETGAQVGRQPFDSRRGLIGFAVLGALIWGGLFWIRLTQVQEIFWRWRDDAVITLSHAKNLTNFGSIGVSPGDRVEGFSSPLQFLGATGFFALGDNSYELFLDLQVALLAVLGGALVALTLRQVAISAGGDSKTSYWLPIALTAGVGLLLGASWTAFGWLASGMENPLAMSIGIGIALLSVTKWQSRWKAISLGLLLALLGLVRIEFPFLMLPVIVAAAFVSTAGQPRSWRTMLTQPNVVIPLAVWGIVQVARYTYFGQIQPNTALAQGRAIGLSQIAIILALLVAYAGYTFLVIQLRSTRFLVFFWIGVSTVSLSLLIISRVQGIEEMQRMHLPVYPILLYAALALSAVQIAINTRAFEGWLPDLVLAGLTLIPVTQFIIMGPARLDANRILSMALPFLLLWLAVSVQRLITFYSPMKVAISATTIIVALGLLAGYSDRVRALCCVIAGETDPRIAALSDFQQAQLTSENLPLAAVADLGKFSFTKKAAVTDLGWLGDPMMARLNDPNVYYGNRDGYRKDHEMLYLNLVAKPDIVVSLAWWSCRYADWLSSEEFAADYAMTDPKWSTKGEPYGREGCANDGRYTIWARTSGSDEMALSRAISESDSPRPLIEQAVELCAKEGSSPFRCEGTRRAIARNLVELQRQGRLEEAVAALSASPSFAMDKPMILRGPGWADQAYAEFIRLADLHTGNQ